MSNRYTTKDIIEKYKHIHGEKYDYSNVIYTKWRGEVSIICPIHGEFTKRSDKHLSGQGCQKCSLETRARKRSLGYSNFVAKSLKIHNNIYSYPKFDYTNNDKIITIICNKHNKTFTQTVFCHLCGQTACDECINEKLYLSNDEFIEKSQNVHGSRYDYSVVNYKSYNFDPVTIICKTHGEFNIVPSSHIRGFGCNRCSSSVGENAIALVLEKMDKVFETEYMFDDCIFLKKLRFDFYIESDNLVIEYDGVQHFTPIEFYGGIDEFNKRIERDKIKNEYCLKNKLNLLRIKYDDDVEYKIMEFYKSLKK